MRKKILLGLVAAVVVVGGVAGMSAYEAHVINVTAHIENALAVTPEHIDFGTVFPEEIFHRTFQVNCSESFAAAPRIDDIQYKLVQKPKPKGVEDPRDLIYPDNFLPDGIEAWDYCLNQTADPEYSTYCYANLCPFLQKMSSEGEGDTEALAYLAKTQDDCEDTWSIAFDVPCLEGYTPQGDPCLTIPDEEDYGCDIWVEVTGFSQNEALCNDGIDNDKDGKIDLEDPGCEDEYDNDETDPIT